MHEVDRQPESKVRAGRVCTYGRFSAEMPFPGVVTQFLRFAIGFVTLSRVFEFVRVLDGVTHVPRCICRVVMLRGILMFFLLGFLPQEQDVDFSSEFCVCILVANFSVSFLETEGIFVTERRSPI